MSFESEETSDFDFDAGVADIADGLGLGGGSDAEIKDDQEVNNDPNELPQNPEQNPEETAAEQQQQAAVREPPKSWAKEQHELWGQIPDAAKDYIETREKQMLDGLEQYKAGHQYGSAFAQALAPYMDDFRAAGVDEITGIRSLIEHHRAITQGTLEQRQQAFIQIGIASGLIPKEGQSQVDPQVQSLRDELNQLKQMELQRQQQFQSQQQAKISQDVEAFAKAHEHFDAVVDDMLPFLQAGMSLQDAYDRAIWANPAVRAAELQKQVAAENERKRQEVEAARKAASTNIRGQQRPRTAEAPHGSWEDTMHATLQNIKNR
jgi:hypothetical protein